MTTLLYILGVILVAFAGFALAWFIKNREAQKINPASMVYLQIVASFRRLEEQRKRALQREWLKARMKLRK